MATFVWEYHATNGVRMEPHGYHECHIYIGLAGRIPLGADPTEETYQIHIDPKCDEAASTSAIGYLQTEWGDVLRLPVEGPHSQDHPYIIASRRMKTHWFGNVKLFPSVYDLMIAASYHADGNTYRIAAPVVQPPEPARPSGEPPGKIYELIGTPDLPHPLSGTLPAPSDLGEADRRRLLSILLGAIHMALAMDRCGHLSSPDGAASRRMPRIYPNFYSVFSANVSPVVLLISYFGIHCSGDGSVQDKLDRMDEYRYAVAECMRDFVRQIIEKTASKDPAECALKLSRLYR